MEIKVLLINSKKKFCDKRLVKWSLQLIIRFKNFHTKPSFLKQNLFDRNHEKYHYSLNYISKIYTHILFNRKKYKEEMQRKVHYSFIAYF